MGKTHSNSLLDQQRVLAAFGEVALKAEDLNVLLTEACNLVRQALKTDFAKVVELLPDSTMMVVRAGVGWKPGVVNVVVLSAGENSPEGLTLKDGAVISPDIRREQRFAYHDFLREHGVQAFVNVLILSGDGRPPFGVLQVDSRSPREFHQSDIEFLRTYANLIGAAIDRFRIVDELRTALREKELLIRDKELLINELNHRVKNTLATVHSITFQTLRNAPTAEQASSAIEGRLRALSIAHDALTRENWEAANLSEIVAQAVEPYRSRGENRIHVRGIPGRECAEVRSPAAEVLALPKSDSQARRAGRSGERRNAPPHQFYRSFGGGVQMRSALVISSSIDCSHRIGTQKPEPSSQGASYRDIPQAAIASLYRETCPC
jgi:two-component sensor histidine kinase